VTSVTDGRTTLATRVITASRRVPVIPLGLLGLLGLSALFAPIVAPHPPLEINLASALVPPFYHDGGSLTYPLGTDQLGRDILSRVIYGGRISILLAVGVICIGGTVGTLLGLMSGYRGGRTDSIVQRGVEATLSLPTIMVAIVFVYVIGQSIAAVVLILSPFIAASFARMVRGETLSVRNMQYVLLARVAGASHARILYRHILPNVAGTIIVLATLEVGSLILVEATLSFLGVGIPPPMPAWGLMVDSGRDFITTRYWLALFPGLAIVLTVLSINWIGDWLRNVLDPKQQLE